MSKQKMWVKKRTSRGGGRTVNSRERRTARNIDRDIRKNQLVYSRYLLKFVVVFALGLVWVRLGIQLGPLTTIPIGLILGLAIICSERIDECRKFEITILAISCIASYFFPLGIVI